MIDELILQLLINQIKYTLSNFLTSTTFSKTIVILVCRYSANTRKNIFMKFQTRKWVKPEDLNPNQSLFGGKLLAWIDEEVALYASLQLESYTVVTKHMSEINFRSSAKEGDIIEIGIEPIKLGNTSFTVRCEVRNMRTQETIITIDSITMVNIGEDGRPSAHGKTTVKTEV